jgi:hypothetical protein
VEERDQVSGNGKRPKGKLFTTQTLSGIKNSGAWKDARTIR